MNISNNDCLMTRRTKLVHMYVNKNEHVVLPEGMITKDIDVVTRVVYVADGILRVYTYASDGVGRVMILCDDVEPETRALMCEC